MSASYKQFCPVAMAAEILCTRWTVVLLRELIAGSTRFNDLHRGVPRMSTALLSKRLKELEKAGIIERIASPSERNMYEYHLTESGKDLRSVIETIGVWGQRWVDSDVSLDNLDPSLLMWDMRRNLDVDPLPKKRNVIEFKYTDIPSAQKYWWLIVEGNGAVDLCSVNPGFDVDLYVAATLRSMTSVWMGLSTVKLELEAGHMALDGDLPIGRDMQKWLGLSPFAKEQKRVA